MRFLLLLILGVYIFSAEIFVATSSNLLYVMPSIVKEFNKEHPTIKVKFIISSSGKLTAQILKNAPYDIFLSADMKYPKYLYSHHIGVFPPKIYAKGKLILFSFKYKDLNLSSLKNHSLAISKPKTTPYGRAAMEVLNNSGLIKYIKRIVYAESVSGVLNYLKNGIDIGIVNKSLIYSPFLSKFFYRDIPHNLYSPLNQGVLLLKNSKEAKAFYNFVLSEKAKKIFIKYGYNE